MAIKNFNFPRVTLTQEFVASNVGSQAILSAACIGRPYYLHRADVESEAAIGEFAYTKTNGVTSNTLPGLTTEKFMNGKEDDLAEVVVVDASNGEWANQKIVVLDGIFLHDSVTSGITANDAAHGRTTKKLQITVGKVIKSGLGKTASADFGNIEVSIGDKVDVYVSTTAHRATITNITNSTASSGLDTITVALDGLSDEIAVSATIAKVNFLVTTDWTWQNTDSTNTYFAIANGTFTITGNKSAVKLDGTHNCDLVDGTYNWAIQYREYNTVFNGVLGSVYNEDAVDEVLGAPCKANPLALAVKFAALAAPGTIIYFTGVKDETVAAYNEANDFLGKYDDIYSIVPATSDLTIIASLLADVIEASTDENSKIRRSLWYSLDPDLSGITANYLRVEAIVSARKTVQNSYKAQAVWADGISYNGEDNLPNWCGAAAAAGMRSFQPCHRPLSNLGYDFFTVSEPNGYTDTQLRAIGAEGIWIIANNRDGQPINKRQVTTAVANDINQDEESIVANADEVALSLCHVGEDKVGNSNITPIMVMALSDDVTLKMDQKLINISGSEYIGPQLLSWTLDSIYQDTVNKDRVYAVISCEPPKPFNEFKMTLRII